RVKSRKPIRHLLRNVLRKLAHSAVHLERASRNIQRNVRAIDCSAQDHEVVGYQVFTAVRDKNAIAKEFYGILSPIKPTTDFREIKNTFKIERVINVEVDPENRIGFKRV